MGARGRAPKPMEQVKLEARRGTLTRRKDEPVPNTELAVLSPEPTIPLFQPQTEQFWFQRIANYVYGVGILRETDEVLVMILAQSLAEYGRLKKILDDLAEENEGTTGSVMMVDGRAVQNPVYMAMVMERANILRILKEIGMTPSARSRLLVEASIAGANAGKMEKRYDFDA